MTDTAPARCPVPTTHGALAPSPGPARATPTLTEPLGHRLVIVTDPAIARGELRIADASGRVLGEIVNLGINLGES